MLHYCCLKVRTTTDEILRSPHDLFISVYTHTCEHRKQVLVISLRGPGSRPHGEIDVSRLFLRSTPYLLKKLPLLGSARATFSTNSDSHLDLSAGAGGAKANNVV